MKLDDKEVAKFSNVYLAYVFDVGYDIKVRALEAQEERDSTAAAEDRAFQSGRVMAFNEVISIMQQNAEGLGIPLSDIRLDAIVPDHDLV
jgi:hypothetical protein